MKSKKTLEICVQYLTFILGSRIGEVMSYVHVNSCRVNLLAKEQALGIYLACAWNLFLHQLCCVQCCWFWLVKMNRSSSIIFHKFRTFFREVKSTRLSAFAGLAAVAVSGGYLLLVRRQNHLQPLRAEVVQDEHKSVEKKAERPVRQGQISRMSKPYFDKFASCEIRGEFYMTPRYLFRIWR